MHHLNNASEDTYERAKIYFTRAVQRSDSPPHPLALYMLGWLAELKGDLAAAERYYCYAVQLDPIDAMYYLKLQQLIKDTLTYVKGVVKGAEKSEKIRKSALKKKLK